LSFRTFGKVRSTGDSLFPIMNRPVDLRSKTVMLQRRRSVENKESIPRKRSVENRGEFRPLSTPIPSSADMKETVVETPPGTPTVRRISSSEGRGTTTVDGQLIDGKIVSAIPR